MTVPEDAHLYPASVLPKILTFVGNTPEKAHLLLSVPPVSLVESAEPAGLRLVFGESLPVPGMIPEEAHL
jgi:hypothetical protein